MTLPHTPDNESIQVLKDLYPRQYAELVRQGYALASDNVLGRCQGPATFFLELDHLKGRVLAWIWLVEEEVYLGEQFDLRGSLGAAVEKACCLLEATLSAEQLSGKGIRYEIAKRETILVDQQH